MIIIKGRRYRLTSKGKAISGICILLISAMILMPLLGKHGGSTEPDNGTIHQPTEKGTVSDEGQNTDNVKKDDAGQTVPDTFMVFFAPDSCELNQEYYQILSEAYDYLKSHPEYKIHLAGNYNGFIASDDQKATPSVELHGEYFEALAQNRAEIIKSYLVGIGLEEDRISISNNGAEAPLNTSLSKLELTKNRRVDITIIK